MIHQTNIS